MTLSGSMLVAAVIGEIIGFEIYCWISRFRFTSHKVTDSYKRHLDTQMDQGFYRKVKQGKKRTNIIFKKPKKKPETNQN